MKTLIILSILLFCSIANGFETRQSCWKLNKQIACLRFDEKCKSNAECLENELCCEYECGTQCRNVNLIGKTDQKRSLEPSPKQGCPPINTDMRCIWFHKICDTDADCKEKNNICCADNCGSFCHNIL